MLLPGDASRARGSIMSRVPVSRHSSTALCHLLLAYPVADERVCGPGEVGVGAAVRHAAGLGHLATHVVGLVEG